MAGKYDTPLRDDSPMPWGKHEGKRMIDVPADYLLWLYDNNKAGKKVDMYIFANLQALRKEVEESKK